MVDLPRIAEHHLAVARSASNGRSTELVLHDGVLRQAVIALRAGAELGEHNSPPAASIQVLEGAVRVTGQEAPVLRAGTLEVLTHQRHGVIAEEDSVFLLTTVTSVDEDPLGPER